MVPILTVIITLIWYWHNIKKDKSATEVLLFNELSKESPNKLLVEKLFFDIYKCKNTTYEEVDILFNHPQSLEALNQFIFNRRFFRIFRLTKNGNHISANYTKNFNSRIKRNIASTLTIAIAAFSYYLTVSFLDATTKSIIFINNAREKSGNDFSTALLSIPDPIIYTILTISFTLLCMYTLGYTIHIFTSKMVMTKLVQTWNLKPVKNGDLPLKLRTIKYLKKWKNKTTHFCKRNNK
ncbi:TPA: hypothetical protein ACMEWZ_005482 [Klebsiella pneumoniae]